MNSPEENPAVKAQDDDGIVVFPVFGIPVRYLTQQQVVARDAERAARRETGRLLFWADLRQGGWME